MSDTVTIGGLPVAPSANLTGAAKIEVEDSTATSGETTLAALRTKVFAGGAGYTAADPLTVGAVTASGVITYADSQGIKSATSDTGLYSSAGVLFIGRYSGSPQGIAVTAATGAVAVSGPLSTAASATSAAGVNIPHGTAPTAPVNGDMWTTTAGAFIRINGVTKTFTLT